MRSDMKTLLKEVAEVCEGVALSLTRDEPFTAKDLTDLRAACNHSAETIQAVRDITDMRMDF